MAANPGLIGVLHHLTNRGRNFHVFRVGQFQIGLDGILLYSVRRSDFQAVRVGHPYGEGRWVHQIQV